MTDETDNDISILGDESEIEARNAGFLPGRNIAPEEPAVAPPPAEESKPDPIAELAAAQAEILDRLPEAPDGWMDDPASHEDIAHNSDLLNKALGVGQLTEAQRNEVVEDALYRLREDFVPVSQLADEIRQYDPKAADQFVQKAAGLEAAETQNFESAAEYLERNSRLSRMLRDAKQAVTDREEAEEAEEMATAAFSDGIKAFRAGLSAADRRLEQQAFQVFSQTVNAPSFDKTRTYSSSEVAGFLQHSLGVAKQLASSAASARISGEFDALDPAPGFMDSPDNRRSVGEHFQAEVQKRVATGEMAVVPPTFPEKVAEQQNLSDPRAEAIEAAWRLGGAERKPAEPPAEIDVGNDDPNSLDSDVERIRRNGWQISKDREPRKRNVWNSATRGKR